MSAVSSEWVYWMSLKIKLQPKYPALDKEIKWKNRMKKENQQGILNDHRTQLEMIKVNRMPF